VGGDLGRTAFGEGFGTELRPAGPLEVQRAHAAAQPGNFPRAVAGAGRGRRLHPLPWLPVT